MTMFQKMRVISRLYESLERDNTYFSIRFCDSTTIEITGDCTVQMVDDYVTIMDGDGSRELRIRSRDDIYVIYIVGNSRVMRLFKHDTISEFLEFIDSWFKALRHIDYVYTREGIDDGI